MRITTRAYFFIVKNLIQVLTKKEFEERTCTLLNERTVEYHFLFKHLSRLWPQNILDIGTGQSSLPHLLFQCGYKVTAIDNIVDYWKNGLFNRHYYVNNNSITSPTFSTCFDLASCISVLEHIQEYNKAVTSIYNLLSPGGHCILTFPYNENHYLPNVYDLTESNGYNQFSFPAHIFSREQINGWLSQNEWELIEQEYWQFCTGQFWTTGKLLSIPIQVMVDTPHHISCLLLKRKLK